jgi:hypothetical protein
VAEPMNLASDDTHEARLSGEIRASGLLDGRTMRRRGRGEQIGLKVNALKKQQLQRIALLLNVTMTEVIEAALDAYEEKLKAGGK